MILAPSVLSADLGCLEAHAAEALDAGAEWLHIDVMDGHFVPNISFGTPVMKGLRSLAEERGVPLDVHLMIENPGRYLSDFAEAGATTITVHQEACPHLHRVVGAIRDLGCAPGVALNPSTPVRLLEDIAGDIDLVLIMSVNPGFSGQAFIPHTVHKVKQARELLRANGGSAPIEVDGGVSPENAARLRDAGAEILVSASAIFKGDVAENITAFRRALELQA